MTRAIGSIAGRPHFRTSCHPTPTHRRPGSQPPRHLLFKLRPSGFAVTRDSKLPARLHDGQKLPDSLSEADLERVAASLLPEGDARAIEILVSYAQSSAKYLAGIESMVRRARYLAGKDGRAEVRNPDIKRAIQDGVIPSDRALARAIAQPERPNTRRGSSRLKPSLTPPLEPISDGAGDSRETHTFTARRPIGSADQDRALPLHADRELVPG